jgi:hypothetical protein
LRAAEDIAADLRYARRDEDGPPPHLIEEELGRHRASDAPGPELGARITDCTNRHNQGDDPDVLETS